MISSQTVQIKSHFSADNTPKSRFVRAALFFNMPNARMISTGMLPSGPILKLFLLRSVCAPHNALAGTLTSPMVSCSMRYCVIIFYKDKTPKPHLRN